jgi:hypothetical protein
VTYQKNNFYLLALVYLAISIFLTILFNGIENINFINTKWLFSGNDMSAHQTGWYFFNNDEWRFPLGSNPNYGDGVGNSIVYSDSIPLLAFFFKSFNFLLPEKFQYFTLWFGICFFLQGLLSNFLIYKFTKDKLFSFLGSFLFIFFPIFIYRMGWHPALFGQWTLIVTIYLMLEKDQKKIEKIWICLILLTSLIHFYFTFINLLIYNFFKLYDLLKKNLNIKRYIQNILITHGLLILVMYGAGYFEVRVVDTIALGFGVYKLNLLSLFDPVHTFNGLSWSSILPDIKLSNGEELEGFNYPGLGGLMLMGFLFFNIFFNRNLRKNYLSLFFNFKIVFLFSVITILSLSNIISFGSIDIIQISLNKFLYGALSITRSSGRLFWIINYALLFFSIFLIYKKFTKRKSFLILAVILTVQLLDTSIGIKNYLNLNRFVTNTDYLKDNFWKNYGGGINKIFTTKPSNYNKFFDSFAYLMEDNKFKKTNIVKIARMDRGKSAEKRYKLYKDLTQKNLNPETIYVIDNLGHLLILREKYRGLNVGFFYRDNFWVMIKNKKNLMNVNDKKKLKNISISKLNFNEPKILNIQNKSGILGFGWSHNFNNKGVWSEGAFSNLLFQVNDVSKDIFVEMNCAPFLNKKVPLLELDVLINGKFNNKIKFKYDEKRINPKLNIKFKINHKMLDSQIIEIEFINKKPISPMDLLISPDSRKIGFILENIKLIN